MKYINPVVDESRTAIKDEVKATTQEIKSTEESKLKEVNTLEKEMEDKKTELLNELHVKYDAKNDKNSKKISDTEDKIIKLKERLEKEEQNLAKYKEYGLNSDIERREKDTKESIDMKKSQMLSKIDKRYEKVMSRLNTSLSNSTQRLHDTELYNVEYDLETYSIKFGDNDTFTKIITERIFDRGLGIIIDEVVYQIATTLRIPTNRTSFNSKFFIKNVNGELSKTYSKKTITPSSTYFESSRDANIVISYAQPLISAFIENKK